MAGRLRTHTRMLLASIIALCALAAVSACSGGSTTGPAADTPTAATSGTAFPPSATYIADMEEDGRTMIIGISVDGSEIAAYACNGTDDEAWFFGSQSDGRIDIDSRFRDTLEATFNGSDVEGDLTVNGLAYRFTATPVQAPAGLYTVEARGVRSSWVVRPDGSALGVQFSGGITGRDLEQAELQQLKDDAFRLQVRNKRRLQQAAQIVTLSNGAMSSTINGAQVSPARVNGTFRLG